MQDTRQLAVIAAVGCLLQVEVDMAKTADGSCAQDSIAMAEQLNAMLSNQGKAELTRADAIEVGNAIAIIANVIELN